MQDSIAQGSSQDLRYALFPSGCIECNAVVLWNDVTRDALVIDPSDDATPVLDFVRSQNLTVRQILLTHGHFDHAADVERVMTSCSCPALLHPQDLPVYRSIPVHASWFGVRVAPSSLPLVPVQDEQRILAFADCELSVLHVPGHTQGSVAYWVEQAGWAFVGDTLFRQGVGRSDLPGGSESDLLRSIGRRLYSLPDATLVIPGHGPSTTIGHEKRHNPFVWADVQTLIPSP